MNATTTRATEARSGRAKPYRDTPVDAKIVLAGLWVAMLFVFAYVDIFGFFRADILTAALDGRVGTTGLSVNQGFLTFTTFYVLPASLMVALSLMLKARVNRIVNLVVSLVYIPTIVASCIGEQWIYYLLGSAVEVVLLLAIARFAWTWPLRTEPSAAADAGSGSAR